MEPGAAATGDDERRDNNERRERQRGPKRIINWASVSSKTEIAIGARGTPARLPMTKQNAATVNAVTSVSRIQSPSVMLIRALAVVVILAVIVVFGLAALQEYGFL